LLGNQLPLFRKVTCGYFTTFAIDDFGSLWSWGGGNLGHKNETLVDLPRRVLENVEHRTFTQVMANGSAAVFFAALRTTSIRPNYGPSCGGTLITLIGTGFCDVLLLYYIYIDYLLVRTSIYSFYFWGKMYLGSSLHLR